ncbi:hypothetical protein ACFS5L_24600 [Streptomyces phyllanthi]|uniref:Uncharacterized protein n=1 Tax=Streptomyces phyllanthi TaxID=1803180 RepID=A0A5N8WHM2_9ACTN|nr:hypothetical protein [Streptomyces phyllanthi]MPY45715.1 hypothetical protein [Streptomyces phyllanthi]
MRSTDHWAEVARDALREVREEYVRALGTSSPEAPEISCMGKDFQVDQVRRVILTPQDPEFWAVRDGKWYVRADSLPGCLHLSSVIGTERSLLAVGFVDLLTRLCAGPPWRAVSESELAAFLNLAVAEGVVHPRADRAIWLTVSRELASGRADAELNALLPELITDHDVLYDPEAPAPRFAERLVPGRAKKFDGTPEAYERQLLDAVLPAERGRAPGPEPFAGHEEPLGAYVREHVFGRVAAALG